VRYRQHDANQFGSNVNPRAQLKRARLLLQGRFRGWVDANLRALQRVRHLMTPENQQVLDEFVHARQRWIAAAPGRAAPGRHLSPDHPGQPRPDAGCADQSWPTKRDSKPLARRREARQRLLPPTVTVPPGCVASYIELEPIPAQSYMSRQFTDLRAVAFVINSMSVWTMAALDRIGAFNERLAIDHVDTEYCLRARHFGLRIYVHGGYEFAHAIGQRRRFRFLGREMQAGGHSADRRRLIARNTVRLARAECLRLPAFGFLCLTRLAYELAGILMAEPQKWTKAMALLRGAASGMWAARLR
jgi:hypothetical protein